MGMTTARVNMRVVFPLPERVGGRRKPRPRRPPNYRASAPPSVEMVLNLTQNSGTAIASPPTTRGRALGRGGRSEPRRRPSNGRETDRGLAGADDLGPAGRLLLVVPEALLATVLLCAG